MSPNSDTPVKSADNSEGAEGLPLVDSGIAASGRRSGFQLPASLTRLRFVPLVMALLFFGAFVGLYFQPPGIKAFFGLTGLKPGGGTSSPIAVPAEQAGSDLAPDPQAGRGVVALGRLLPKGDVILISPPYGSGDARIAEFFHEEGDWVKKGDRVASLDNLAQLQAVADKVRADVGVRRAALEQTTTATHANYREAVASRDRAETTLKLAQSDLQRAEDLFTRGVTAKAAFEAAETAANNARQDLERAEAVLSRYAPPRSGEQADIKLAQENLLAAEAELARAEGDLAKGYIVAPADGMILSVLRRVGERPGNDGIAILGNTSTMTVELEVYQSDITRVRVGQAVAISAAALSGETLAGTVTKIGLEVTKQALVADDPAANTDARVILVTVELDAAASQKTRGLTGLEVVGRLQPEQTS